MKLFTVGPVEMYDSTLSIAGMQLPYFRTDDFSNIEKEIEKNFLSLLNAPEGSRAVLLTASGSGAMECAVINGIGKEEKTLVINGGGFGQRFCEICRIHHLDYEALTIPFGECLTKEMLLPYAENGFTRLLVNGNETSTAQLYDLQMLGDFCKDNGMKLIVDAVSCFLADYIDMKAMNIDMIFTGSQKALALSPGLAIMAVSAEMYDYIEQHEVESMYFDLKLYFENMERGQTPFTPAVGVILELQERLNTLCEKGIHEVVAEHKRKADYFRNGAKEIGLKMPDYPMGNGVTALLFPDKNAHDVYVQVKEKYGMELTPNGGTLADTVLRVGHMGNLTLEDYDAVLSALKEVLS